MSLRTKLLAALVGLNGAILLLAVFLLLRSETERSNAPSPDLVANLLTIGGAVTQPPEAAWDRTAASRRVDDLRVRGVIRALYVVEETAEGHRVWRADDFLAGGAAGDEVEEADLRQTVADAFLLARREARLWSWAGPRRDTLAVVLPMKLEAERRRGLVAMYVAPPDPRRGIQGVYVVMVVGVVVLTAVSFFLVSRLVVRPLRRLAEGADRIARGDYRTPVVGRGTNDEFDRTTRAFNRMAREIAEYQGHLEDRVLTALNRMRKAEQHLAIAQRLAATGKLASGVAHEINNPLGGLKNALRSLARGDLTPEKTQLYLELISEGLGRIEETVKKFLSFTPRQVEPRPTDFAEIGHMAAELARHRVERSGARLEEELPEPGKAQVFGDPHELQQVALNLLLNAADAVADRDDGRVVLRLRREEDEVVLEVEDNGVGLGPEDQDRCFDMFFTTKGVGEGTGLGLAVAHTIVTNHGGRIEVDSRAGEGATFRVVLPTEPGSGWAESPDPGEGASQSAS